MKKTKRGVIGYFIARLVAIMVICALLFAACNVKDNSSSEDSDNSNDSDSGHKDEEGVNKLMDSVYHIYDLDGLKTWASNFSEYSAIMYACITWDSSEGETWTPVGTSGSAYKGEFDGGGHTVSNLAIGSLDDNNSCSGFFGYLSGTVKNLGVEIASFTSAYYAGGIAGYNYDGEITACYSTCSVEGRYAGGIVGYNYDGEITACYSTGSVEGIYAGGIAGLNDGGTITDCYSTGDITATEDGLNFAGGIASYNYDGEITACYSTGNITATEGERNYVGGIAGRNERGTIIACYSAGNVTATEGASNFAGGIAGSSNYEITACYSAGNVIATEGASNFAGGIAGFNGDRSQDGEITACYWSAVNNGVGAGDSASDSYKVDGSDWSSAMAAMNGKLSGTGWTYENNDSSTTEPLKLTEA